ncbi:hypothetical protein DL767_007637 [Monosporascus sp. MG133]|nr:hypothetical protein DL767_007637 [Monosporascus sp. MG133]
MSSFSSGATAAASNLARPRIAVVLFSAATAAVLGYYLYATRFDHSRPEALPPGPGLRRRNAVRRVRLGSDREESEESESHGDENAFSNLRETIETSDSQANNDYSNAEWYNDAAQEPRQRAGENIVTLLFRVSEDNARRNAYVHRGCQCNGCGMVPIRGIRYRCANCADFDLCEVCEAQGLHNKTHIFYKVRVPAPPFGPRLVQPPWYPGDPDNAIRSLPRSLLAKWTHETGFERVELDAFWEQWTFMANTEWRDDPNNLGLAMDRKTFERCLVPSGGYRHASPNLIHDRMFAFYDTNHDDLIGFEEFLHGVSYRKRKDKLKRTFDGYDIDGDGYVNRRDFLRMFRAYYVLYKQMHRDILEGLDDHMMTTTEAQQLINSRQPLSSLFGREGRVPPADHNRPMEGKVFQSDGEVRLADDKGVVSEDRQDTANREEILTGLFTRNTSQSFLTESFGPSSSRTALSPNGDARYWSGIINPPQNMVDLSSLLSGDYTQIEDILDSIRMQEPYAAADEGESESSEEEEENGQSPLDEETPGGGENEESAGPNPPAASQPIPDAVRFALTESRLRAQHRAMATDIPRSGMEKRKRVHARRQLHERWKRRQFYLDEEEGATPPQGWQDSEDVLANLDDAAESSKSAQLVLSPRSRSSSKVRFAEDTDDFDIRSNPSTSSRSVPERWGGMEIPDAERDAGKEILYQVTQQAFNELLDELFRKKEDLAVRAAETKEDRLKYRHLLENINLEDEEDKSAAGSPKPAPSPSPESRRAPPVAEQSVDELLSSSGYTVDPPEEEQNLLEAEQSTGAPISQTVTAGTGTPSREAASGGDATTRQDSEQQDPTMPQFRPNTNLERSKEQAAPPAAHAEARISKLVEPDSSDHIPHSTLVTWKRLDLAEQEARERGGWGRLSYEEFRAIYREHDFQDSSRNRLDYLGSWIDFCIP